MCTSRKVLREFDSVAKRRLKLYKVILKGRKTTDHISGYHCLTLNIFFLFRGLYIILPELGVTICRIIFSV